MPLHTLMFGWEYPPANCGGLGVACQGIVRGLLHHGARVTLVLPHDSASEPGATILSPGGMTADGALIRVPSGLRPYDSFSTYGNRVTGESDEGIDQLYGSNLGEEVERFTAMAVNMTKHVRPDVIHTHDWMTVEAGARAARYHGKPLIAHVHATELDRTEFKPNPWIMKREIAGLKKADKIIAVSGYTRDLLVREYGIKADKIAVLHNGSFGPVAPAKTSRRKAPLVLFLGRLTVQKGAQYFIQAASRVLKTDPLVRFVVAGEGYLLAELIGISMKLGLSRSMIFAGRVTSKEARKLYEAADCFVMPSVSEPFGLVALEAITHGAPVVLSKQSGASEVIHNSLLVDFWDTDKMADCILTLLRHKPMVAEMRSQTPRILSGLTWHKQGAKILSMYDRIIRS